MDGGHHRPQSHLHTASRTPAAGLSPTSAVPYHLASTVKPGLAACHLDNKWAGLKGVFISIHELIKWRGVRRLSVCPSVCKHFAQIAYETNGSIATKLAHDGLQVSAHPGCAQGQGQGKLQHYKTWSSQDGSRCSAASYPCRPGFRGSEKPST